MNTYMTGYNGSARTRDQLFEWREWQALDPEVARRVLAIVDASISAGRPLGVGGIFRSATQQTSLFLSRHIKVDAGGCCHHNGQRYAPRPGVAHAAPPGRSYHEATTPDGKALAIDFTGDLAFLATHAAAYGLREFTNVNNEPWHAQPTGIPTGRTQYGASHHPLDNFPLPPPPAPAQKRVFAPVPTLRQDGSNDEAQVRGLQLMCNFWGWRDALGRTLIVDGSFAAKTDQAVRSMQRALKATVDGVYGPQSARLLQQFLDAMIDFGQ